MKKKLLVVGSNSIHVHNFIDLVKDHFDKVLLLTNEINYERGMNELVTSVKMDFSLGIRSLDTIGKIRKTTSEFKPSVVHIHQANTYLFLTVFALKNKSIPLVLTAWGSDILVNPQNSFVLKSILRYTLKQVHIITADSNYVLNEAQKLVNKKLRVENINFGVVMDDCPTMEKEKMIYSNRLHKSLYNIDKVILSFSRFIVDHPDWKLVIAGSGEDTEVLKTLVENLQMADSVDFVGFLNQEENYRYYCRSKIYVSIPQSDSISMSLVEAIICGCIPFVSDIDANKELIKDEKNGFIEEVLEEIHFEKFEEVQSSTYEERRKEIKKLFSKPYNKNRYLSIYKELGV